MDFLHVLFFFFFLHTFFMFYTVFSPSRWLFSFNTLPCSFASRLLICLSVCLGCVWPCPSLSLQEVVSRLIESWLRSLELNTCLEELLFNCSSHTLTLAGCWYAHMKHIHTVFDLPRSHSLVLALSFSVHGSGEMNEKRGGKDEWVASRRSVRPEMGQGRRDGAMIICVCALLQAGQAEVHVWEDCLWACFHQSTG